MDATLSEIVDTLEMLLEDLPSKPKVKLQEIIEEFSSLEEVEPSRIMKIQDDLELLSTSSNLDSFSRNEIINVLSLIETLL